MKVFSDCPMEANVKFNSAMIDSNGIVTDGYMYIPYKNKALCEALGQLAFRIASQNDWVYPDYNTVKTWLVVDTTGEKPIQLLVEVEPPRYTERDKAELLSHASTEPIHIDCDVTMRSTWLDIFKASESFHKGNTGDKENMSKLCYIDMTNAEEKRLQKFVDAL